MTTAPLPEWLFARFDDILAAPPIAAAEGDLLGHSREGREVRGIRVGDETGEKTGEVAGKKWRISLIGGCHADEPVGPRLLRHLVAWLRRQEPGSPARAACEWWVVPHLNPDGEARNRAWYDDADTEADAERYLAHVVRELPGDDIEFGFPHDAADDGARPENRAVFAWWRTAMGGFDLHASLHGMAVGAGPWFLFDEAWEARSERLRALCRDEVRALGYVLHDVERHGEKGFRRFERGFCRRPDADSMRRHFLAQNDPATAALFRPTSMETIRALSADALTLVSEMPLFLTPGVGETLGPPDPVAVEWKQLFDRARIAEHRAEAIAEMRARGLRPMPMADQMRLQWRFITAGIAQILAEKSPENRPENRR